jgi:hypothetical protein
MYDFIFNTVHPDIDLRIDGAVAARALPSIQAIKVAGARSATPQFACA